MDVRSLKCLIKEVVYKRALHSQYGMQCNVAAPCLYANLLFTIESECTIPDNLQAEIDKLTRTIPTYAAVDSSTITTCNIAATVANVTDSCNVINITIS